MEASPQVVGNRTRMAREGRMPAKRRTSLLWSLLGASALIYLACMDVLYNLENGMYAHLSAEMAVEIVINVFTFAVGAWFVVWFWRQRAALLALPG